MSEPKTHYASPIFHHTRCGLALTGLPTTERYKVVPITERAWSGGPRRASGEGHMPPDLALVADPATIPGAWEREIVREVPGGVIAYHEAPAGWLTKAGEERVKPYREYVWTPEICQDGHISRAVRLPSVTYICDQICPKPGIPRYSEDRGIEGCLLAFKAGMLTDTSRAEDAIAVVREQGLGAEAATARAARRGLNIHAINEDFLRTGDAPVPRDHPEHHRGFIRSWAKATLCLKPEPVAVEQVVVHPELGYAGRLDMRAIIRGELELDEWKTQEWGGLFSQSHIQTMLYERAAVWCGAEPASRLRAIVLPADGDWNERQHTMIVDWKDWQLDAALAWWRAKRPIDSACESRNRTVRA